MTRTFRGVSCLVLLFTALPSLAAPARLTETARYGVYLLGSRIGSMTSKTYETTHANRPAVRLDADMAIKMVALGNVEQGFKSSAVMDKAGKPLLTTAVISSMGRVTSINARYEPTRILCSLDAGGQKSSKVVLIPKGVKLSVDPSMSGIGESNRLKVGQKSALHFFEPTTLSIQRVDMEVLKAEKRTVGGKQVQSFLLKSSNSISGESQTWVDSKGHLLEENSSVGLRLVREDVDAGPTVAYEPPRDFAVATSVKTAVKLPDARKTALLRLKVAGIPEESLLLSDTRQQIVDRKTAGGNITATYLIQPRELPARALPVAEAGATNPDLAEGPYLGVDDPAIRKQAKELAGGETDRAVIARRIRAWVKAHMLKPTNVGVPRSGPEIMRSRDGVCRDYATLFAAVARAAGVPTRLCSGIVYFQDGFFYHAWVECQLTAGADGWFAFDPTLEDDFVDATHVKFAQGGPTDMFAAVRLVGVIQAEILEHK